MCIKPGERTRRKGCSLSVGILMTSVFVDLGNRTNRPPQTISNPLANSPVIAAIAPLSRFMAGILIAKVDSPGCCLAQAFTAMLVIPGNMCSDVP
ncbi:hypothetical protein BU24DRAFT_274950 [Aaosphaeria arxii CBS 175.79]|uniref:Uncharacterized protein n=1 Tax=Aaosphaeria arxii CBS 175.79 TaxID=1450172 RepID=A0A6A5XHA6_9PLEO|nr:uncharacterized protein BU24DRAFT_274950 [Aaosphaeria arxii CBS 175.79]KAF2012333.1 hypothetical protein BU24DRAFT_274950 [Aaosphaeria arxii CBS 175.79]